MPAPPEAASAGWPRFIAGQRPIASGRAGFGSPFLAGRRSLAARRSVAGPPPIAPQRSVDYREPLPPGAVGRRSIVAGEVHQLVVQTREDAVPLQQLLM